jgi:signal transduction histidine kinase
MEPFPEPLCGADALDLATFAARRAELLDTPCIVIWHCGAEPGNEVFNDIAALRRTGQALVQILAYAELSPNRLVAAFRAGIEDALPLSAGTDAWLQCLSRAEESLALRVEAADLAAEQQDSTARLRDHQRRLQNELLEAGSNLARSHARLESVNRELSLHMNQLSLLYSFGRELSTARNWDQSLESILATMAGFIGAEGAALVLCPAPDAPFAPRKTFRWGAAAWERVLEALEAERRDSAARDENPGMLVLEPGAESDATPPVTALPLEHAHRCLGYLLLLDYRPDTQGAASTAFLHTVQVILAEEVASAQMLDRMRELGTFNSRVLESVRNGIWVLDDEGRTIYCNRGARTLLSGHDEGPLIIAEPGLGIGRGRAAGRDGAEAGFFRTETYHLDDLPELCLDGLLHLDPGKGTVLARMAGRMGEPYLGQGRLVREGGDVIPVQVQSSAMSGRGRDETWLVIVLEDLRPAERLAAEKRRADSLQSLVEMSATLAHEIRNPLMGLSAQAELLADSLEAGDPRSRYIDVITHGVERIDQTITRMLQYVRPYAPQLAEADLAPLIRESIELARPRAEAARVSLPAPATLPPWGRFVLPVDAAQIAQVLLNLLFNAVDEAPAGGSVRLEIDPAARRELADAATGALRVVEAVRLAVVDDGKGFGDLSVESLFRPFFTTKSTGTGLGLPLCRKIIEAHGGVIDARREGAETMFEIFLPVRAAAAPTALEQETP